ncbi:hypothetical protein HOY82DRAFT_534704 [Tuber indicum]|nr:hypothetical protein HOY82DRAFT_534704 [Tuber indicum]
MSSNPNYPRTQVTGNYVGAGQSSSAQEVSNASNRIIGPGGASWIRPKSSQPPDPLFDTLLHRKMTHALLAEWGMEDLIPTPAPADVKDPLALLEHEDQINSIVQKFYPDRLSPVDETLFMTPRKKAIIPTYIRTRIATMYRKECESNMDSVADDPEVVTSVGPEMLALIMRIIEKDWKCD